jgi:ech hydrogenase subunit D
MQEEVISVGSDTLVGEVAKTKVEGFRFVTMSCVELDGNTVSILYHFDKDLTLKHLRLTALKDSSVPSISTVYFAAFLVENEIQDLFGIRFKGLVLDYERTLYLDEEVKVTPFCRYTVEKTDQEEPVTQPSAAGS